MSLGAKREKKKKKVLHNTAFLPPDEVSVFSQNRMQGSQIAP